MKKLLEKYSRIDNAELISFLEQDKVGKNIHLKGLSGSSAVLYIHQHISKLKGSHLLILGDREEAAYFYNDLVTLDGPDRIMFFPSSYTRSIQYKKTDESNIITRTKVLKRLSERRAASFVVTYPEALMERVLNRNQLEKNSFEIRSGEKLSREFLTELLVEYGFELVDFVYEPGQYAVRGSIMDIFSFSSTLPYRVDFFGDEIESIRSFDIETQLSVDRLKKMSLIPNIQWEKERGTRRVSIFEYLPGNTKIWSGNFELIYSTIDEIFEKTEIEDPEKALVKSEVIVNSSTLREDVKSLSRIEFGGPFSEPADIEFNYHTAPQPAFNRKFELLAEDIIKRKQEGYEVFILSDSEGQINRLKDIFTEINPGAEFEYLLKTLHQGFVDHDLKLCVYTDHQIFERYHKYKIQDRYSRKESLSLKELTDLKPGDYVVHIDHGIGIFGGLETVEKNGKKQESVRLIYKDRDVLFVSIHALHRISKYKGKDDSTPRIYKLGSGAWQKLKSNTKKKVKDIAAELIKLYALRKEQKGFSFSPDTYLQRELEASFIYEDTPDQVKATESVKEGMEADFPMDRLVCGDVGFGKTEVAIRAAFKAVTDSKQVAVLVPTTILALQHYNTFRERLNGFPCTVEYISRLRSSKKQREVINATNEGKVDILIGTHKLVGKELNFKDLGLLIIDEEQKFGVSVKEKLRQMKVNVDTLTLTATPIPRTLQFSLLGARDLSVINTPPPNRHPIITELHSFNEDIIREAIEYEVARGGQVFFIHNRVDNIGDIEVLVNKLCKGARAVVAHGQMEGKKLENIMLDFIQGYYDVLIATTIIESGLDIPNANTIIINNAHHFGLSDLHQLRGRVGRSNKKAFCYLLAPPLHLNTPEARRRLKAIEEFSELGSGFNIAMQDLDIRGAGDLLGAEQSGFISDVGYETYQRILDEAILELKENEFKHVFEEPNKTADKNYTSDCQIDTDLQVLIPEEYISNITERMRLYRELDNAKEETGLTQFREKLEDRFGSVPPETEELIKAVKLRWLAMKTGIEKIMIKEKKMVMYFVSDPDSAYYQSETFSKVLNFVQLNSRKVQMRENNDRLSLSLSGIDSISEAIGIVQQMRNTG
ncbi:MAG: transcription-repair coupling factor [Bacteroidales bacterium]